MVGLNRVITHKQQYHRNQVEMMIIQVEMMIITLPSSHSVFLGYVVS